MLPKMREDRLQLLLDGIKNTKKLVKDPVAKNLDIILNITEMRKEKGLSIRKLSLKSGIARGYISELCNGIQCNPSLDVLVKLAKAFDCTLDELVEF
jgi:putative transcriptional regulator